MVEMVLSVAVLSIMVPGVTILSGTGVFGGVDSTTPTRSRVVIPVVARALPGCVDAKVDLQTQRANTRIDNQSVPVDLTC